MGTVTPLRKSPEPATSSSRHLLDIPGTDQKVSVEVELVPADQAPESIRTDSNVAMVNVGGREFFALVGKTTIDPYG